jgi:hypothetical protein
MARPGAHGESGAAAAEHVALVAVVGAVIAALFAVPLAPVITDWGRYAVCSLFGGDDCERPLATGDLDDPLATPVTMVCLEARDRESAGGSMTIVSVKASGELAYQIDRRSDGSHDVTLEFTGGLAGELVAGGKLSADALGVKQGRSGAVELGGEATLAPVFAFDSEQEAVRFAESARDLVAGPGRDAWNWRTLIPGYGPGRVAYNQFDRIRSFDPPAPTRVRVEGSVDLVASGGLYGGAGGLEGLVGGGRTVGADIDLETGDTTVYVALDARIAGELGLGPGVVTPVGGNLQPGGELGGEVVVGVTVDASLVPQRVEIGATVSGHGGLERGGLEAFMFEGGPFTALERDLSDAIADVGVTARDDRAFAFSASAELDLSDPRVGAIGDDLLAAIASRDAGDLRRAGGQLRDHLLRGSDLQAQLHAGSRAAFDLSASGGKGLAFGFGLSHERSEQALAGAWHRPPGGAFGRAHCG